MNREQKRELELGTKAANLSRPLLEIMILPFSLLFMVKLCVSQLTFFSVILYAHVTYSAHPREC